MTDTKIKYVATIKSEEAIKEMGAILWQKQFNDKDDVVLYNIGSEEKAREWLKTIT